MNDSILNSAPSTLQLINKLDQYDSYKNYPSQTILRLLQTFDKNSTDLVNNFVSSPLCDNIISHYLMVNDNSYKRGFLEAYLVLFEYRAEEIFYHFLNCVGNTYNFVPVYAVIQKFKEEIFEYVKNAKNFNNYLDWLVVANDVEQENELFQIIYNNNYAIDFLKSMDDTLSHIRLSGANTMQDWEIKVIYGGFFPDIDDYSLSGMVNMRYSSIYKNFEKFLSNKPMDYQLGVLL